MKKTLLLALLLTLALAVPAYSTDVTLQGHTLTTLPFVPPPTSLGRDYEFTVTVTSGSALVTITTGFPSQLLGKTGATVGINGVTYQVTSVPPVATGAPVVIQLNQPYSGVSGSATLTLYKWVWLRIHATQAFRPAGSTQIIQASAPGSGLFYAEYAVSIINTGTGNVAYIPAITLPATTDSSNPNARYVVRFYSTNNTPLAFWQCPSSATELRLPPTVNNWADLCTYNGSVISAPNASAYTKDEFNQMHPSCAEGKLVGYTSAGLTQTCITPGTGLQLTGNTLNAAGGGSGSAPAGSGTELQIRQDAITLGALLNSASSGSSLALGGAVNASALLTLNSTTKGFLPPRMTTTQRDAIASPTQGLIIHNTTTEQLNGYVKATDGTSRWQTLIGDNLTLQNPHVGAPDTAISYGLAWNFVTAGTSTAPNFSTEVGQSLAMYVTNGQNDIDQAGKKTYQVQSLTMNARGSGQRVARGLALNCFGVGDCIGEDMTITMAGSLSSSGDEGFKWQRFAIQELNGLQYSTVTSIPAQATINTTLSGAVTRNISEQPVPVGSSAGVVAGQWMIVDDGAPTSTGYKRSEAVKVTAVPDGTHITGVFTHNHDAGAVVVPATVLVVSSTNNWGPGRTLVNMSATAYTTGTARCNPCGDGAMIVGSGTSWASNMLTGGTANNPGAISFEADDVTTSPFSPSSRLRAWYPILQVNSSVSLSNYRASQVGQGANYYGLATSLGNYTIRPAARLMSFDSINDYFAQTVVLSPNSFTWQVGDIVELAHSTSFDGGGATWDFKMYLPGQTYRDGLNIRNSGMRDFATGLTIGIYPASTPQGWWTTGADISGRSTGLRVGSEGNAISINSTDNITNPAGKISWSIGPSIQYSSTNGGLLIDPFAGGANSLAFKHPSVISESLPRAEFTGTWLLQGVGSNNPYLQLNGQSSRVYRLQSDGAATNALTARVSVDGGSTWGDVWRWGSEGLNVLKTVTATNGSNWPSYKQIFTASIYNGSAAVDKTWFFRVDPLSNSANADQKWSVWRPTSNASFPVAILSAETSGKFTFGIQDPLGGGIEAVRAAVFDPTGITAGQTRTYTMPDVSATLATRTGTFVTDNCVKVDANKNFIDAGVTCGGGGGGGGSVTSITAGAGLQSSTTNPITTSGALSIVTGGVTNAMLAGSITDDKLNTISTPGRVNASALGGTIAAGVFPTLTGDVTTPGASLVTTIANDAVTFAKMANLATNRLIGRSTAGTGDPEAITPGSTLSLAAGTLDVANQGITFAKFQNIATARVLGRSTAGSGSVEEINIGTGLAIIAGTLSATGGGTAITVKDEGSTLGTADTIDLVGAGVTGTFAGTTLTITVPGAGTPTFGYAAVTGATYTISGSDNFLKCDTSSNAITISIGASGTAGRPLRVWKSSTDTNICTISDGTNSYQIYAPGGVYDFVGSGSAWLASLSN